MCFDTRILPNSNEFSMTQRGSGVKPHAKIPLHNSASRQIMQVSFCMWFDTRILPNSDEFGTTRRGSGVESHTKTHLHNLSNILGRL